MAVSQSGLLNFRQNPIAKAEFRHQRHVINTSRSGLIWIVLASLMLIPGMLFGLGLFGAVLLNIELPDVDQFSTTGQIVGILVAMLITMNVALYLVVILITLGLSARSITREKTGGTWDALVLTNIDARTIVLGKWWASLRALWGDHLMVALLRLGFLGMTLPFIKSQVTDIPFDLSFALAYVLPATVMIFVYTAFDAAFTAALGIAMPLSGAAGSVIGTLAIGLRIFATILLAVLAINTLRSMALGDPWLLMLGVWLVVFGVCIAITLRVAEFLAVRGQVSAPGKDA